MQYKQDKRSGKIVEKSVPSFDIAVKNTIFGEGAERIVRKFSFLHDQNNYFVGPIFVAKESRFVELESGSNTGRRMDYHREFMRTQAISSEYARKFNKALEDIVDHFDPRHRSYILGQIKLIPKIEFLEPMVVETYDPSKKNPKNKEGIYEILVEPFLEGKYEKFNDNMGMVKGQAKSIPEGELMSDSLDELKREFEKMMNDFAKQLELRSGGGGRANNALSAICEEDEEEEDDEEEEEKIIEAKHEKPSKSGSYDFSAIKKEYVPQAFSHFTFENSQKNFMVVDLQGVHEYNSDGTSCFRLTDPVIHDQRKKKNSNSKKHRSWSFGRTDRGRKGMKAFFHTHQCNDLCRLLGLEQRNALNL